MLETVDGLYDHLEGVCGHMFFFGCSAGSVICITSKVFGYVMNWTSVIQPPGRLLWSYPFFLKGFCFFSLGVTLLNSSLDDRLMSGVRGILHGMSFV